ncbi:ribonuclease HII [Candidatus Saccharibacteria bacterium TM7i]|nr:ribonuclease HII [Candidatus Saccharibacteria bacterium TM7i]
MILGIDEVGRGPWAGPLVVGAVVLGDAQIEGLNDSKQLTKKKREALEPEILEKASATGLGWVSADELDSLGLSAALRLATIRAVKAVDEAKIAYDEIIIDGTINFLSDTPKGKYVETMPKADGLIPAVSAASIIAKVARDRFMEAQDATYPGYSFGAHAGYGTEKHRAAIELLGVTPLHRLSFGPLKKYVDTETAVVTTKQIGDAAENVVVDHLKDLGHTIIERNWRTRFCEIDIISEQDGKLYFTEVKYRKNDDFGGSVAAITPKKLQQMKFAAELYLANKTRDTPAYLATGLVDDATIQWMKID